VRTAGIATGCALVALVIGILLGGHPDLLPAGVLVLRELAERLAKALATDGPLDANERRARAGIVSRQVTLR
jgi:hypothetical protein